MTAPREEVLREYGITVVEGRLAEQVDGMEGVYSYGVTASTVRKIADEIVSLRERLAAAEESDAAMRDECSALRFELRATLGERDALVRAIDDEMVSCHIGVFNLGDDPKKAINALGVWSQGVGAYFAERERDEARRDRDDARQLAGDAFREGWDCGDWQDGRDNVSARLYDWNHSLAKRALDAAQATGREG